MLALIVGLSHGGMAEAMPHGGHPAAISSAMDHGHDHATSHSALDAVHDGMDAIHGSADDDDDDRDSAPHLATHVHHCADQTPASPALARPHPDSGTVPAAQRMRRLDSLTAEPPTQPPSA